MLYTKNGNLLLLESMARPVAVSRHTSGGGSYQGGETKAGNFRNFRDRLGLFRSGAVLQALLKGGEDTRFGVVFDGNDKGEAKGGPIGLVEGMEALVFSQREAIEANSSLLLH